MYHQLCIIRLNSEDFSKSWNRGNIIFWLWPSDRTHRDLQKQPDFFSNDPEYSRIKSCLKWKNGSVEKRQLAATTCYTWFESSQPTASNGLYGQPRVTAARELYWENDCVGGSIMRRWVLKTSVTGSHWSIDSTESKYTNYMNF